MESFNYVFQMTGGSKEITREEMRAFKKVWAEFANPKTGYLERNRFVAFFAVRSARFVKANWGLTLRTEVVRHLRGEDLSNRA